MKKIKRFCPISAIILFGITLISGIINIVFLLSSSFSDYFNRHISGVFRLIFAKITGIFAFSVAEILLILAPLLVVLLVVKAIRLLKKDSRVRLRFLCGLFAVICFFYSSFVMLFAGGYRGSSLDSKMLLERKNVTAQELEYTANILLGHLIELKDKAEYGEDGFSKMPYDFTDLNNKLNTAYSATALKYDFLQSYSSKVKAILLSEPMTYTHISGVYTYFTGEANINTNFPDYTIPYTAAHEMAHQRGIAREDEANFVAFLVCIESEDDYIKYSGYLNLYEYVLSALRSADRDIYSEVVKALPDEIKSEWVAYSQFFDKYRDNKAADISGSINNNYLISQGQVSGTKSYGLVVDLAVAYYNNRS